MNQPTRCSNFSGLLLVIYRQLNMFWASSCPSSGATTTAVAASGLPLERRGSSAVGHGQASQPAQPWPTALLPPHSNCKPEAATAVIELLMMGMRMSKTCWAVFKRQVRNLRNCCIWLVDTFEYINRVCFVEQFCPSNWSSYFMHVRLLVHIPCWSLQGFTSAQGVFLTTSLTTDIFTALAVM